MKQVFCSSVCISVNMRNLFKRYHLKAYVKRILFSCKTGMPGLFIHAAGAKLRVSWGQMATEFVDFILYYHLSSTASHLYFFFLIAL